MPEHLVAAIRKKRTVNTEVRQLYWLDYEHCCKVLEAGIKAEKLNFSNEESRPVTIYLTNKRKDITYRSEVKKVDVLSKLSGSNERSIPVSTFINLVYGGQTSTFY